MRTPRPAADSGAAAGAGAWNRNHTLGTADSAGTVRADRTGGNVDVGLAPVHRC
ncbi:hypothetical protein [Kitasatospora cheerisanensis]|uniref:hypothetical protein n=1 Tax=Kitasatospora cheerisanensis TaxID=81942 RepID=UPI000B27B67F|nr:hypothetical protein [Kitasatospora cheerisanensis]